MKIPPQNRLDYNNFERVIERTKLGFLYRIKREDVLEAVVKAVLTRNGIEKHLWLAKAYTTSWELTAIRLRWQKHYLYAISDREYDRKAEANCEKAELCISVNVKGDDPGDFFIEIDFSYTGSDATLTQQLSFDEGELHNHKLGLPVWFLAYLDDIATSNGKWLKHP